MGDGFQTRVVHLLQKTFLPIHAPQSSLSLSLILYSSLYLFTRLYPSPPPSHTTTLLRLVRDNDSEATPYSREYTRIGGGWLVLFPGWRVSRS